MGTFEQRKLIRVNIILKVMYKTQQNPQEERFAFSKNISSTGINIIMPDKLEKDTEIDLKVFLPGRGVPIIANGKAVWQAACSLFPDSKKKYYSTGIRFGHMSDDDAITASEFIKNVLKKQSTTQTRKIIGKIDKDKPQ